MRKSFVRGRSWWNWLLGNGTARPAPRVSQNSHKVSRRPRNRHRSLTYEALEPLCMLTSSAVISGPQSVMEPTASGTTTSAQFSISLPMFNYGDSGTVHWATEAVAGGAVPGQDYVASSGTVSLSYLNTQVYVTVPVSYDMVSESSEALRVVLSSPTGNLAIMVGTATTNIIDNNPPPPPPPMPPPVPTVIFSDAASNFLLEGQNREIHVIRDMSADWLTVYYVIADDSVATSSDVGLAPAGSVEFIPGQTDATITLTVIDDSAIEVHELLKLSLVQFPAPNQGPGAYMVGSTGNSLTTIGDNNEDIFSDLTVAWKESEDHWVDSPDNEMLWQGDELRWTVTLPPEEMPFAAEMTSLKLLKRPHADPAASWEEIAPQSMQRNPDNLAQFFIVANPLVGDWDINVHGLFGFGINAWLPAPKHRPADAITSTRWTIPTYDPLLRLEYNSNEPYSDSLYFGQRVYPEYTLPPDHVSGQSDHTWVDVEIRLAMAPPEGFYASVYMRSFDPDHVYDPPTWNEELTLDPNDVFDGAGHFDGKPNDNRFGSTVVGGGGFLQLDQVTFDPGATTATNSFKILAIQPGNNFRVGATNHQPWLSRMDLDLIDDVTIRGPGVTTASVTEVLTVWRTLHIEQDSMGPPSASDLPFAPDDVPVADVREAKLGLLNSKFQYANVEVVADLGQYEARAGASDNAFFMMNLESSKVGDPAYTAADGMRDVTNATGFWTVQIVGSYDAGLAEDNDGETDVTTGITSWAYGTYAAPTVFIFTESIRDAAITAGVDESVLEMRTVVHEVGHTFIGPHGSPGADDGIMIPSVVFTGSDTDNVFSPKALAAIQSSLKPQSGLFPNP